MTSAKQLAHDVVSYANKKGHQITNLKLQKMLYYLQGYYARQSESALFGDEIVHWPYGPVIPSVYFEFCQFGASAIRCDPVEHPFAECSDKDRQLLKRVIDACLSIPVSDLVERTHREAPWKEAQDRGVIPFDAIMAFFSKHDPLGVMDGKAMS